MRVPVSRALRIEPGDTVNIRARLVLPGKLHRLFVFSKDRAGGDYSPYVAAQLLDFGGEPRMVSALGLRVSEALPTRELHFVADFDGYIKIMQEVDRPNDVRARVSLRRQIDPALPWQTKVVRRLSGMAPWHLIQ